MANELYKDHMIVCGANRDTGTDGWIPEALISWKIDGVYQFHYVNRPPTQEQADALALAKQLAEKWVDDKL